MIVVLALFTSCKNAASGWSPSTPKAFYNIGDVILTDGTKIDYDESRENFDEKYPIFNYALTYGTNGDTNLIGTIYENDWFVPSIAELIEIYMNLYLLDSNVLYQLGSNANIIGYNLYHSSSQCYFDEKKCMEFDFSNKKVGASYKIQQFFVRVVHKF